MREIKCVQKSSAWFEARRGVPTASVFSEIMTPKTRKMSASAIKLCYELVAQIHYPGPLEELDRYQSAAMRHGNEYEAEARAAYNLIRDDQTALDVGFIMDDLGRFGCSPDALCFGETEGGLELKCPSGAKHVEYLHDGILPTEYMAQVHGALLITGRLWWDFMSYSRGLPPLIVRVTPSDFTRSLRDCLDLFWVEFEGIRKSIARLKSPDESPFSE